MSLDKLKGLIRKALRLVAGVAVSVGILWSLDYFPWSLDVTDLGPFWLLFALAGTAAVSIFAASAAGAFVARLNFTGPAIVLSFGVWYLLFSFLRAWSDGSYPDGLASFWIPVVGSLPIIIGSAIVGARFGRQFTTPKDDSVTDTA